MLRKNTIFSVLVFFVFQSGLGVVVPPRPKEPTSWREVTKEMDARLDEIVHEKYISKGLPIPERTRQRMADHEEHIQRMDNWRWRDYEHACKNYEKDLSMSLDSKARIDRMEIMDDLRLEEKRPKPWPASIVGIVIGFLVTAIVAMPPLSVYMAWRMERAEHRKAMKIIKEELKHKVENA